MRNVTIWNPLVPQSNRLESPNCSTRRESAPPTHIVIHITGTDSLASVKRTFLARQSVSAHYLIGKGGELYQFVPDQYRAWHSGIDVATRSLFRKGQDTWSRYIKYFSWYKGYPRDAVFVDGDLNPVWRRAEAVFVAHRDGRQWDEYDYFSQRWGEQAQPVNFEIEPDPNNYSIGIEILGFGSKLSDPSVYTPLMYQTLVGLVEDLADRYDIPMRKGRIIGHEDVNPVARFGWDPNQGFDWSCVHAEESTLVAVDV